MGRYCQIINTKINSLEILSLHHKDSKSRKYYNVRCDCGTEKVIHGAAIKSGNTKSCGCLVKTTKNKRIKPNNHAVKYQIFLGYKRHARERYLKFNLEFEDFKFLIIQPCHYCGIQWSNIKKTKNCKEGFQYNGIDRINSSQGYFIKNCVTCCRDCNLAKSKMTKQDFLSWIERVYKFSIEGVK